MNISLNLLLGQIFVEIQLYSVKVRWFDIINHNDIMLIKTRNWGAIMEKDKHLGIKINKETHKKLKLLAEFNARSISSEIIYLIQKAIREHEAKYGQLE